MSRSPSWSSASQRSKMEGRDSVARSSHTSDVERATESPDVCDMEEAFNITSLTPLQQRIRKIATTKMDDTNESDIATTKMATTLAYDITDTSKMATSTSKMADATSKMASTGFKAMIYNPTMPLEMAEDLPPSAVTQQAEKMADAKDRSRCNNLRFRGIPDNVDTPELLNYFQSMVKAVLPRTTNLDLPVGRIHRLPKPNNADAAAPKDTIARLHFFHIKEELLRSTRTSGLPGEYKNLQIFQDFSAYTMRRRRKFQPFTAELQQRGIRYRWGFPVKVLFHMDGRNFSVTSQEEGMKFLASRNRHQAKTHALSPSTPAHAHKKSKADDT
ncbi:Hypothetical predicted protein [Pelobates cultripes]|uniref:Uncharacterized protein n=1 Tax=Pelobates cultripes TaxID=61616 RepID=A0AAD1S389_PELCU|nr:Hypothetical predicted protein [Pelobates cultripes]